MKSNNKKNDASNLHDVSKKFLLMLNRLCKEDTTYSTLKDKNDKNRVFNQIKKKNLENSFIFKEQKISHQIRHILVSYFWVFFSFHFLFLFCYFGEENLTLKDKMVEKMKFPWQFIASTIKWGENTLAIIINGKWIGLFL